MQLHDLRVVIDDRVADALGDQVTALFVHTFLAVNDLFAVVEKWPASDYKDYCHYNKAASKRLGEIVAERLAKETGL